MTGNENNTKKSQKSDTKKWSTSKFFNSCWYELCAYPKYQFDQMQLDLSHCWEEKPQKQQTLADLCFFGRGGYLRNITRRFRSLDLSCQFSPWFVSGISGLYRWCNRFGYRRQSRRYFLLWFYLYRLSALFADRYSISGVDCRWIECADSAGFNANRIAGFD